MQHFIKIEGEYIKLDQLLKYAGVVGSGSDAKYLITNGHVNYNHQICLQRGKKIYSGDYVSVTYQGEKHDLKITDKD